MKNRFTILSSDVLNKLKKAVSKNNTILAVYLFGSRINGIHKPASDLDFAVVVSDKKIVSDLDILGELSKIPFPLEIDISVVDLNSSPLFLFQIIKNGICVYEKIKKERLNFEAKILHTYYDTQYLRDIYHLYLDKSIKEGTYGRR